MVGNDGSIYVVCKEPDFDAEKFLVEYGNLAEQYKRYHNNATRAVAKILKEPSKYGLLYKKGRKKL